MKRDTFLEIAIRLIALYSLATLAPALATSARSFLNVSGGVVYMLQGFVLTLVLGLIIPVVLWLLAPTLSRFGAKLNNNTEMDLGGLSTASVIYTAIACIGVWILVGAIILLVGAVGYLFSYPPALGADMGAQLQYNRGFGQTVLDLVVRFVVGAVLFFRANELSHWIAARFKCTN